MIRNRIKYLQYLLLLIAALTSVHGQYAPEKNYFPDIRFVEGRGDKLFQYYNPLFDQYDVHFYKLDLSAGNTSAYIEGSTTIGASVTTDILDTLVVQLIQDYTIDSVLVNKVKNDYIRYFDEILIPLENELTGQSRFTMEIFYRGEQSSLPADYLGINNDSNLDITFTLSEPFYSRAWFPSKPVLTDKADSVFVFITTDENLKVGSNGVLTAEVPLPGNRVRHEWKSYYPTAYYLISICVGDYYEYNLYAKPGGMQDSVLIQNYFYSEEDYLYYKAEVEQTVWIIEAFSELFGMYPFYKEKYGHCMAPIGGGMEHQTMTTLSGFNLELIAHELAHQWFGDYVTCGSWQDIWINEGFATYAHLLALEYRDGSFPEYEMLNYHTAIENIAEQNSVYVPELLFDIDWTDEYAVLMLSGRLFDYVLSYLKGAAILHMIRYELGNDTLFFQILREYLSEFQFGNATGTDFQAVLEEYSGMDFGDFFDQWYFGEGYPIYDVTWFQEGDSLFIQTLQTPSASTPLFKGHLDYRLVFETGDSLIRLYHAANEEIHSLYMPDEVINIYVDPHSWNMKVINRVRQENFIASPVSTYSSSDLMNYYPNPFTEFVNLEFRTEGSREIRIYNGRGKLCEKIRMTGDIIRLDMHTYQAGVYIVEILENNKLESIRLVKP